MGGDWRAGGVRLAGDDDGLVIGQQRDGRHSAPWSRGYLHPVGNQNLRFRKRDGSGLAGAGWKSVYREDVDHLSRDKWIDAMEADGVLADVMFDVDMPLMPPWRSRRSRSWQRRSWTGFTRAEFQNFPLRSVIGRRRVVSGRHAGRSIRLQSGWGSSVLNETFGITGFVPHPIIPSSKMQYMIFSASVIGCSPSNLPVDYVVSREDDWPDVTFFVHDLRQHRGFPNFGRRELALVDNCSHHID
jgi:hypothetical protein